MLGEEKKEVGALELICNSITDIKESINKIPEQIKNAVAAGIEVHYLKCQKAQLEQAIADNKAGGSGFSLLKLMSVKEIIITVAILMSLIIPFFKSELTTEQKKALDEINKIVRVQNDIGNDFR